MFIRSLTRPAGRCGCGRAVGRAARVVTARRSGETDPLRRPASTRAGGEPRGPARSPHFSLWRAGDEGRGMVKQSALAHGLAATANREVQAMRDQLARSLALLGGRAAAGSAPDSGSSGAEGSDDGTRRAGGGVGEVEGAGVSLGVADAVSMQDAAIAGDSEGRFGDQWLAFASAEAEVDTDGIGVGKGNSGGSGTYDGALYVDELRPAAQRLAHASRFFRYVFHRHAAGTLPDAALDLAVRTQFVLFSSGPDGDLLAALEPLQPALGAAAAQRAAQAEERARAEAQAMARPEARIRSARVAEEAVAAAVAEEHGAAGARAAAARGATTAMARLGGRVGLLGETWPSQRSGFSKAMRSLLGRPTGGAADELGGCITFQQSEFHDKEGWDKVLFADGEVFEGAVEVIQEVLRLGDDVGPAHIVEVAAAACCTVADPTVAPDGGGIDVRAPLFEHIHAVARF